MTMDAALGGHLQELRRGTVVVASLTVLRSPGYGYSLLETLSAAGFEVEANTLYPLLRRLEAQGLLTSEWNTDEARPRKFYRTTSQGDAVAHALRAEWARLDRAVNDLDGTGENGTAENGAIENGVTDNGVTANGSAGGGAIEDETAITPGSEK